MSKIRDLTDREQELILPDARAYLHAQQQLEEAKKRAREAEDRLHRLTALLAGEVDGTPGINLDEMYLYVTEDEGA